MPVVAFEEWEPGFDKVAFNRLLRMEAGLGLAEAKQIVDQVLDGESVAVSVRDSQAADHLVAEASRLGVVCRTIEEMSVQSD